MFRSALHACCEPKNRVAFERKFREKVIAGKNDYLGYIYQEDSPKKSEDMIRSKKITTIVFDQSCPEQKIREVKNYLQKKRREGDPELSFFVISKIVDIPGIETIEKLEVLRELVPAL